MFLAAFSMNEYFTQVRQYANSSLFTVYHQSFTLPVDFIAVNSRRRDGNLMVGGYRHGAMIHNTGLCRHGRGTSTIRYGFVGGA